MQYKLWNRISDYYAARTRLYEYGRVWNHERICSKTGTETGAERLVELQWLEAEKKVEAAARRVGFHLLAEQETKEIEKVDENDLSRSVDESEKRIIIILDLIVVGSMERRWCIQWSFESQGRSVSWSYQGRVRHLFESLLSFSPTGRLAWLESIQSGLHEWCWRSDEEHRGCRLAIGPALGDPVYPWIIATANGYSWLQEIRFKSSVLKCMHVVIPSTQDGIVMHVYENRPEVDILQRTDSPYGAEAHACNYTVNTRWHRHAHLCEQTGSGYSPANGLTLRVQYHEFSKKTIRCHRCCFS